MERRIHRRLLLSFFAAIGYAVVPAFCSAAGVFQGLYPQIAYQCATNYYVDVNTGNDSNNGTTPTTAWKTIAKATYQNSVFGPGVCVNVAPGTYSEPYFSVQNSNGASGNQASTTGLGVLRCNSNPVGTPTAQPFAYRMTLGAQGSMPSCFLVGTQANSIAVVYAQASYTVVDGFDITSTDSSGGQEVAVYIFGNSEHHVWILNNYAHDVGGQGIGDDGGDFYYFMGNVVNNCASRNTYLESGFSIASPTTQTGLALGPLDEIYGSVNGEKIHIVVANNISANNIIGLTYTHTDGNGIIFDTDDDQQASCGASGSKYPYGILAYGNVVYGNGGAGIATFYSNNIALINNTSYLNYRDPNDPASARPEFYNHCGSNNLWQNNVSYNVIGTGVFAPSYTAFDDGGGNNVNNTWSNNTFYLSGAPTPTCYGLGIQNNGVCWYPTSGISISTAANSYNTDPQWSNPSLIPMSADFRPQAGSPILGTGTQALTALGGPAISTPNRGAFQSGGNNDTIPPVVVISSPSEGATFGGTVMIFGTSSDNVAVSSVGISVDGGAYSLATGTATWTFSLNTTALSDGPHALQAEAWDTSGNASTSVVVNVNVTQNVVVQINMATQYGISLNGIYNAIADANTYLSVPSQSSNTYILNFGPGTFDLSTQTAPSSNGDFDVSGIMPSSQGRLIIQGAGSSNTTFILPDFGNGIFGNSVAHVSFIGMYMTRPSYTVSQGHVASLSPGVVVLNIQNGFPSPTDIWDSSSSATYLRQYTDSLTDPQIVQLSSQIAFATVQQISGQQWQFNLNDTTLIAPYPIGALIGIKSKDGPEGNGAAALFRGGFATDIVFDDILLRQHTLLEFRGGSSQIRILNTTIARSAPINGQTPCMASPGGGPQLGNVNDLPIGGLVVDHLNSESTGDDSVAFFNASGTITNSYIRDSFARGLNLNNSPGVVVDAYTQAHVINCDILHQTASGQDLGVSISTPSQGSIVSGIFPVDGYAHTHGSAMLSSAAMSVDGGAYVPISTASIWASTLNVTNLPPGPHYLTATDWDTLGDYSSFVLPVIVISTSGTAPSVAITSPTSGATLQGVVAISGTSSDIVLVSSVAVSIDSGAYAQASGTATWIFNLNTSTMTNGAHTLRAKAWDSLGNASTSTLVNVTVNNNIAPSSAPFSSVTTSQLQANWGANGYPGGTHYLAILSTGASPNTNGFSGNKSSNTLNLDAVFTSLNPNTTYYVSVATSGAGGAGVYTSLGSTATLAAVPASAAVSNVAQTALTLSWNADGDPPWTKYLAQISTSGAFATLNASSSTLNTSATFLGLVANTTYFLRVAAVNSGGLLSAFAVAAASSTKAALPLSAAPSNVDSSSVTANWGQNGNSTTTVYLAEISTNNFATINASIRTKLSSAAFTALAADTAYNFQVAALGNDGSQTPFTALPSTATLLLPPAISSMTFASVNFSSVTVQWLSGGDGAGTLYRAQVSTNNFLTVNASSLTYNLSAVFGASGAGSALAANTTYFFQVQATTTSNSSAFVALGSTATPAFPPTGTSVVSVASTTVKLSWSLNGNPSTGTTFQLWQALANNFPSPIKTFLTSTSTIVSLLSPNTTYFFKVRVLGNDGIFTSFDSIVSTTTLAPAPGAPGTPAGVALGVSSISWNWSAAQYASSYQLIRAQSGNVIASTPTLAFFDAHLATNTAYGLIVQGVDATGPGLLSSPATFFTLAAPPSGSVVTPVFATSATLSWSLDTNPSGTDAEVQRSTNGTSFVSLTSSDVALAYIDTGLLGCSTYYYRVRNSNGNDILTSFDRVAGPFVTSNTIPAPASGFSAQSVPGGHVNLNWTQSPTEGIVGYQLFYDAGAGSINYNLPSDLLATLQASATSYETAVLPSSAAYTFALLALHRCDTQSQGVFAMAGSSVALNEVRADIIGPASGHHVYGNDLTVYAQLVAGTPAQTAQVTFQYRRTGTMSWSNMTAADAYNPNPATVSPFFIHWNVDSLVPGSYDLSAVALDVSGSTDTSPDVVTVLVDPVTPDILETTAGGLVQTVFTNVANTLNTGGNAAGNPLVSITVPGGLLSGSTVSVTVTPSGAPPGNPPNGLTLVPNLWVQVALSNGQSLLNGGTASLSFYSPSAPGTNPQIYVYNTASDTWSQDFATTYNPATHQITGNTPHFSVFAVLSGGETPAADLTGVRVYPNPYRPGSNNPDLGGGNTGIFFDQLPTSASIKIYTVSGRLVASFDASSATGAVNWDARNDKGRDVASGLYLAVITSPGNKTVTKKFLVVR